MEENIQEKTLTAKISDFIAKWGGVIAAGLAVVAFLFLLAPNVMVETKYYVGDEKVKEYFAKNIFDLLSGKQAWAYASILGMVCLGAISNVVGNFVEKAKKNCAIASTLLYVIAIAMIFIGREVAMTTFGESVENFNDLTIEWGSAAFIVSLALASFVSVGSTNFSGDATTQAIAEDGVLIAAAFVLNFIKLFSMPAGGSVNLQMLPLMIIALRRGPVHGLISGGLVYGLLTCITDGYGLYTLPFDYFVAFGSVAVLGIFKNQIFGKDVTNYNIKGELFLLGAGILSTGVRFLGHCASSIIFYETDFAGAAAYNAGYVGFSGLIALVAIMALYGPLAKVNKAVPVK